MKLSLIIVSFLLGAAVKAQTAYDVIPGTKGNRIVLSVANISQIKNAENVSIKVSRPSLNINFNKNEVIIKRIETGGETEAAFLFDIKREAPVNKADTLEFIITDNKGIFVKKEFVLSFTPPKVYRLEQNYPNPFNPVTTILYQLPLESRVTLKVYDILGSEVETLVNEIQSSGYKEARFGGEKYSSGVYIYRLDAESTNGNYAAIKKMVMIK
ncbi:MAG TPA: T9SS type A sorting domain-containing protein [Ignavibacteriaceae bacterium]|nr:T9SS type A sorting domain-containing protein [Ignavibacteriaceae bacterium]